MKFLVLPGDAADAPLFLHVGYRPQSLFSRWLYEQESGNEKEMFRSLLSINSRAVEERSINSLSPPSLYFTIIVNHCCMKISLPWAITHVSELRHPMSLQLRPYSKVDVEESRKCY